MTHKYKTLFQPLVTSMILLNLTNGMDSTHADEKGHNLPGSSTPPGELLIAK